jgi:RHS repeat-associated protein
MRQPAFASCVARVCLNRRATYYVGAWSEVTVAGSSTITKSYYYFGSRRVAVDTVTDGASVLVFLAGDQLGSTSIALNSDQSTRAKQTYRPYGAVYAPHQEGALPTDYEFTGQRHEEPGDLYQMGARWYDPFINRWVQPDTIIPDWYDPQSLNRYTYVSNNPLKNTDPTGHYGQDVHHTLTYYSVYQTALAAATQRGMLHAEAFARTLALQVATADMAADGKRVVNGKGAANLGGQEVQDPTSWNKYNPVVTGLGIGARMEGSDEPKPHWHTTDQASKKAREATNAFDFGIALHAYQDSFAHWQKLGRPDAPEDIWGAHSWNQIAKLACLGGLRCNPRSVDIDAFDPDKNSIDANMLQGMDLLIEEFVDEELERYEDEYWDYIAYVYDGAVYE